MRTIGETIKSLRLEKGMSQEQFAALFNVAASTVGMWENNNRVPNEETKEAIADYFNVDMNFLYGKTPIRNSYRDGDLSQWKDNDIPEIHVINRAAKKMDQAKRDRMMTILRASFMEEFDED